MRSNEFARIHHCEAMLENVCFRLENSCEYFVNFAKNGSEQKKKKAFFMRYKNAITFSCIYTH